MSEPKRITDDLIAHALGVQGDGGEFNPLVPINKGVVDAPKKNPVEAAMRHWSADTQSSFEDTKARSAQPESQVYTMYPSMVKQGHHAFPLAPKDSGPDWLHRTLINLAHIHFGTSILKNVFRYNHFFAIPDDVFDFAPGDATDQDRGFYVRLSKRDNGPALAVHVGPVIQDIEQAEQTLLDGLNGLWEMLKNHHGSLIAGLSEFSKEDLMVMVINARNEARTLSEINRSLNAVLQGRKEDEEALKIPDDIKAEIEAGREPLPKDDLIKRIGNDGYQAGQDLIPDKVKDPDPRRKEYISRENEELRQQAKANIQELCELREHVGILIKNLKDLDADIKGVDHFRLEALKENAILRADLDGLRETATAQQNGLSEANRLLASKTEKLAKLEKESVTLAEQWMQANSRVSELEKQIEENKTYKAAFLNLSASLGDNISLFTADVLANYFQYGSGTYAFERLQERLNK